MNNGSTLTVGKIGSATGSGIGLTVSTAGTGTLAINTSYNTVNGNSSIDGTLTVNTNATLQINTGLDASSTADFIATGLAGGGTIVNGGGVEHSLFVNSAAATTFSGVLADGSGGGKLDLNKGGAGTLTLTNVNTYTGQTTFNSGTIVVANASALSTGNIQFPNASTGTLDIALNAAHYAGEYLRHQYHQQHYLAVGRRHFRKSGRDSWPLRKRGYGWLGRRLDHDCRRP